MDFEKPMFCNDLPALWRNYTFTALMLETALYIQEIVLNQNE